MSITELAYMVIGSPDVAGWKSLAQDVIGFAARETDDGALFLKMDERDFRIMIVPHEAEHVLATGWAVRDEASYLSLRMKLLATGVELRDENAPRAAQRRTQALCTFKDPAGNAIELCWGIISDFTPFISPVGVPRFVTGDLGMGHIALPAPDLEASRRFWTEVMGFSVSDILTMPFGGRDVKLYFTHCDNRRQHSLALAGIPHRGGCVHFAVEMPSIVDVGKAMDRVEQANLKLAMTLGQHVNDDAISFYFLTPGGTMMEIGCEGALMEWERHTVFETTLPSRWGHKFLLHQS
jgi:3,4-dihydroxy-9,10-secoandrosta-1,3,5(10)-triene-9,17-dione 4,5-dioxygenase